MLDFDTAQQQLAAAGPRPRGAEPCALGDAAGRILAAPFVAAIDLPPHDNSAMDGYALRHADYQGPDTRLPVQQRCFAGQTPDPLLPGQATRLFTGSLIPPGADTVVMQEDCTETNGMLQIHRPPTPKAHVRYRGEDMALGQELLPAGIRLGAPEIAVLASQGAAQVQVYPRLKVGILTTGDELTPPGQPLGPSQIYNSNSPMLSTLVQGMGASASQVLHAADTESSLRDAFALLLRDCDLVLTVGGVSVGEKDLVKPVIESLGGTLDLWRVNIKPGKPVALARIDGKPVVCLPGNPVSAFAVFTLLVSPLVRAMQGRTQVFPEVHSGMPERDIANRGDRIEFMRVRALHNGPDTQLLTPYAQQGSGIISSLPWATGLARIPASTVIPAGSPVAYYSLAHWLT